MIMYSHIHPGEGIHLHHAIGILPQFILALPFVLGFVLYSIAVWISNRKYKQKWPVFRTGLWTSGTFCAILAVVGPLAEKAHVDFTAHMIAHLLLGMLAPLLMVIAAPMTLALRCLPITQARRLAKLLDTMPVRIVSDPIVATLLNVGGLWILYTTNLYTAMHEITFLHIVIHTHVFLAGYVFTLSMIYIDPKPHHTSHVYRSVVLVIALAGHGILSKYIYAHPPAGVSQTQAEIGAMLMYYGGDIIDAMIILILCYQWYKDTRPRLFWESELYSSQST
nr:cytochrome c oxidase assembly protein [Alkalihalobacterium alkalinitrilicum]